MTTLREIIEQNITVIDTTPVDAGMWHGAKCYTLTDRAQCIEELEYLTYVLYQSFHVGDMLKTTGKPEWAQKNISYETCVPFPKALHHVGDCSSMTMTVKLRGDDLVVGLALAFDLDKTIILTSTITVA